MERGQGASDSVLTFVVKLFVELRGGEWFSVAERQNLYLQFTQLSLWHDKFSCRGQPLNYR